MRLKCLFYGHDMHDHKCIRCRYFDRIGYIDQLYKDGKRMVKTVRRMIKKGEFV